MQDGMGMLPMSVEVPTTAGQLIVRQGSGVPALVQIDSDDAEAEQVPTSPRPVVLPEERDTWKERRRKRAVWRSRLLDEKKHGKTSSPANMQPQHAPLPAGQVDRQSLASASGFPWSNTGADSGKSSSCFLPPYFGEVPVMHCAGSGNLAIPSPAVEPYWCKAEACAFWWRMGDGEHPSWTQSRDSNVCTWEQMYEGYH